MSVVTTADEIVDSVKERIVNARKDLGRLFIDDDFYDHNPQYKQDLRRVFFALLDLEDLL
jgi:hypothetical protein